MWVPLFAAYMLVSIFKSMLVLFSKTQMLNSLSKVSCWFIRSLDIGSSLQYSDVGSSLQKSDVGFPIL